MKRLIASGMVVMIVLCLGIFAASASACSITLTPDSGPPGISVTATSSSCTPSTAYKILWNGSMFVNGTSDSSGADVLVFTVPEPVGKLHPVVNIVQFEQGGFVQASATFTYTGAAAVQTDAYQPAAATELPGTGFILAVPAAGFAAAAGGAMIFRRRRRH